LAGGAGAEREANVAALSGLLWRYSVATNVGDRRISHPIFAADVLVLVVEVSAVFSEADAGKPSRLKALWSPPRR